MHGNTKFKKKTNFNINFPSASSFIELVSTLPFNDYDSWTRHSFVRVTYPTHHTSFALISHQH